MKIKGDNVKRTVFCLALLLIAFGSISADEIAMYVGNAGHYNEYLSNMTNTQFAIKYNTERDQYFFFSSDFMSKGWVYLDTEDIQKLRDILNKYLEWEVIAIENDVLLKKEIPNSRIEGKLSFRYGDEWYSSSGLRMNFTFFSQSVERHQLVIGSNKVDSTTNQFIDYQITKLYLGHDDVVDFLAGISPDTLEMKIQKFNAQDKLFQ